MSLGADIGWALPSLRAQAETMMADTCTITRGGTDTFNETTGQYETTPGPTVYAGKCRIQNGTTQASNPEAGGAVYTVERVILQLPHGTVLEIGDIATINTSLNPMLAGNEYRVTGLGEKTHATAARYVVEVHT